MSCQIPETVQNDLGEKDDILNILLDNRNDDFHVKPLVLMDGGISEPCHPNESLREIRRDERGVCEKRKAVAAGRGNTEFSLPQDVIRQIDHQLATLFTTTSFILCTPSGSRETRRGSRPARHSVSHKKIGYTSRRCPPRLRPRNTGECRSL